MKIQILSDLHLETESYSPQVAEGADLLVLAGDVDTRWASLEAFSNWPVPVVFVPGNHEFDGRDVDEALTALRQRCASLGIRLLSCDSCFMLAPDGRRIRLVGATRWCDFDLQGEALRPKAMRAAGYYLRQMNARRRDATLDAANVRDLALQEREWLVQTLRNPSHSEAWDATVVITHFAPSARSADPRYGVQPSSASFCNADDDLLPLADLWVHGHLHCRHDYLVEHDKGATRVVCNPRGHSKKSEPEGFNGLFTVTI